MRFETPAHPRRTLAAAAAAGVAAQTVQVVCLREVLQIARGGEAVLGMGLAAWLVGSGLGAATWRWSRGWSAALVAVVPLATVALLRALPAGHGGWAPAAAALAGVAAYPPGAYFATVLRRLPPGRALMAEAAGACLAGALLTLLLLPHVNAFALALAGGALCLAGAARYVEAGIAALALLAAPFADRATIALNSSSLWAGGTVLRTAETPYGRHLWLERGGQRSLFTNGQLVLTLPDRIGAEAVANVVLAAHPDPRRVLVLGAAGAGVLQECLRHPVERLEWAVQDEALLDLLEPMVDLARVRVRIGDLRRIAAERRRDLVWVLAGEPLTLATNRLYTREFFSGVECGLLVLGLPAAPNEREGHVLARNVSVFRALDPLHARVLPGPVDLLLAAPGAAPDVSAAVLSARLRERRITFRNHADDFFAESFRKEEVDRVTAVYRDYPARPPPAVPFALEESAPAGDAIEPLPNRDDRPGAVLHSAAALARREQVPLLGRATGLAPVAPWALLAAAAAALAMRKRAAAALAAATTGAASMGLWIVLLMLHQARVGALYGDLALLASAFMAGFALGARVRAPVLPCEIAFAAAAGALPLLLPVPAPMLAALVGVASGAALANVAAAVPARASRLYAWDLAGAALAALVFGTFLIPAVGATTACLTAAGLKVFSALGQL